MPLAPPPSEETSDQPPHPHPAPEVVAPTPEPPSRLVLPGVADDTLSHHVLLNLSGGYANVFGSLDSQTPILDKVSGGYSLSIGAGYGLSRQIEIELNGSLTSLSSATGCPTCTAKSYGVLGAIRYHLVQGVRFDPWVRVGAGGSVFRLQPIYENHNYAGLQWFTGSVGGDWYISKHFALGPLVSLALTSYLDHPGTARTSIAAQWLIGANLAFDANGK